MNVVDHLPKTEQPAARQLLHGMAFANSRAACERKRDQFVRRYEKNYPKAAETLLRDWDRMITFYEFPKQRKCANLSWKLKRLQTLWFDGIGRNNIKPVRERSRDEESVTFGEKTQEEASTG